MSARRIRRDREQDARRALKRSRRKRFALSAGAVLGATAFAAPAADALTYTVTNDDDDAATPPAGSLRAAIEAANATPGVPDEIVFDAGVTGTIVLDNEQLYISDGVDVQGPGARTLTVSADFDSRVIGIYIGGVGRDGRGASPEDVTLSGLTIANGGLSNDTGAGIESYGADLNVVESTVSGNVVSADEEFLGAGAGILVNYGSLDVVDSTISGNTINEVPDQQQRGEVLSLAGFGGGIYVAYEADLGVVNSTISGNAAFLGGGIAAEVYENSVYIQNSTIADNTAAPAAGGIYAKYEDGDRRGFGGGDVVMLSTIVGDNLAAESPDLAGLGGVDFVAGWSLIEDTENTVNEFGPNIFGVDPQLGDLQNNGGPTDTHLPAAGSPAIDKGVNGFPLFRGIELTTDQRGQPRTFDNPAIANAVDGDGTDIGSVELPGAAEPGPGPSTPTPVGIPQCLGQEATIVGTNGKDTIVGTEGRDVIKGLRGNDTIKSLGGDDIVCGDKGTDKIRTADGDDSVRGGNNGDRIRGGTGDDTLRGGAGIDNIRGEDGDDQLFGGAPRGKTAKGLAGPGGGNGNVCDGGAGTDTAAGCETERNVP